MSASLAGSPKLTASLVALCLGLSWMIYDALEPSADLSRTAPSARSAGAKISQRAPVPEFAIPDFQAHPIDDFGAIVERPLFNNSRRPITVAGPEAASAPVAGAIMLSGIVIDNDRRIAHLKSDTDTRIRAVGVGDAVGNWRVELILPDRVVLRSNDMIKTIFMQKFDSARNLKSPSTSRKLSRANQRALQRIYRKLGADYLGNR
jgi:hypothetical protein